MPVPGLSRSCLVFVGPPLPDLLQPWENRELVKLVSENKGEGHQIHAVGH